MRYLMADLIVKYNFPHPPRMII